MRDMDEVIYDALHAGVVEHQITDEEAEEVIRILERRKITGEEQLTLSYIGLAAYIGDNERNPEDDVRWLLQIVKRLSE